MKSLYNTYRMFYTEIVLKLLKAYKSKFNNKLQKNKNIMQTIDFKLILIFCFEVNQNFYIVFIHH